MPDHKNEITRLLEAHSRGEEGAFEELVPIVYDDLHRIARRQLRRGRPGDTLNTTGLVHEAYLKMVDQSRPWGSRCARCSATGGGRGDG